MGGFLWLSFLALVGQPNLTLKGGAQLSTQKKFSK